MSALCPHFCKQKAPANFHRSWRESSDGEMSLFADIRFGLQIAGRSVCWLSPGRASASAEVALKMQRPLPDGVFKVVAVGPRKDGEAA